MASTSWSSSDVEKLKEAYSNAEFGEQIMLSELAIELGRLKSNVSRKARSLGLTNIKRKQRVHPKLRKPRFNTQEDRAAFMSAAIKEVWSKKAHPRGALGMKHTDATKEILSKKSNAVHASMTEEQKAAKTMKMMRTKVANGTANRERPNASWKSGWREIGGVRKYYRSKWEANYAYYLEWLKQKGQIKDWLHEPITFWFEGVRRGCVSYLPDFWVKENNDSEAYHEVKGWMDDRSKTKIRRMAKYHPEVKLVVVDSKGYAALKKSVKGLVPGWEA